MERAHRRAVIGLAILLACCPCAFTLDPSLEISSVRAHRVDCPGRVLLGNIYAMAQTPDGYLWFGTEFGLFRFDGVRSIPWQPPAGQHLPDKNINSLLVTRDGTLWIGTFSGLVTWNGVKLTWRPEPELGDSLWHRCSRTVRERCGPARWGIPRPALRNPKRQHAVLRGGWRLRQSRLGFV